MDKSVTILDKIGVAALVHDATVVIGDNITALKWASVDAVTPGNAHIRAAYHWLKDTLRDGYIDLRDIASALNLADFLTKVAMGPQIRASSDAASGYSSPPANGGNSTITEILDLTLLMSSLCSYHCNTSRKFRLFSLVRILRLLLIDDII